MPELISVIVTTYNREDALEAVLSALSGQTDREFEVVVADDGSRPTTAALIERWKGRLGIPLSHVWQADRGFRAAEIRNRALLAARGDYCVFLDGDCIARADFVATHRRLAERGWFVTGNRVLLSRELTAAVLREGVRAADLEPRPMDQPAGTGRRQSARRRVAAAARSAAQAAAGAMAGRALLQSCGLALRSRACRRLRRELSRLGP